MAKIKAKQLTLREFFEFNLVMNADTTIYIDIAWLRWNHSEETQDLKGNVFELKELLASDEFSYLNDFYIDLDVQEECLCIYLKKQ